MISVCGEYGSVQTVESSSMLTQNKQVSVLMKSLTHDRSHIT